MFGRSEKIETLSYALVSFFQTDLFICFGLRHTVGGVLQIYKRNYSMKHNKSDAKIENQNLRRKKTA